jgi:hypothetical protein
MNTHGETARISKEGFIAHGNSGCGALVFVVMNRLIVHRGEVESSERCGNSDICGFRTRPARGVSRRAAGWRHRLVVARFNDSNMTSTSLSVAGMICAIRARVNESYFARNTYNVAR